MSRRVIGLWLAIASCCPAQVALYRLGAAGEEIAVGSSLDLGSLRAGDTDPGLRLRLRHQGRAGTSINALYAESATPGVFAADNYPSLPHSYAPGANVDFRLKFIPRDPGRYTGTLFVVFGSGVARIEVNLAAVAPEAATLRVQQGASFVALTTATTVDFGRVERRQTTVKQFALVNLTNQRLTVSSVLAAGNSGSDFAVEGLRLPLTLDPGAIQNFPIRFAPLLSGVRRGTLTVDGRVFDLEGFAVEPALPTLRWIQPAGVRSGVQVALKIGLSETSRAVAAVKITLAGLEADPAVALLPTGGRLVTLPLKEGDTELAVLLQTGTTQGPLKLTAETGTQKIELDLVLAPLTPVIATATGVRQGGRLELRINGFDNTRAPAQASFWFYNTAGNLIGQVIRTPVTDAFVEYFSRTSLGGQFSMAASFPVTGGDITTIGSYEMELTNAQGATRSARVAF
jgi:hypothetical protein